MKRRISLCVAAALALGAASPAAVCAQGINPDAYAALPHWQWGTDAQGMTALEKQIQASTPEQRPDIEDHMIAVLQAPDATAPAKEFACRMLRVIGSGKCIPVVIPLLTDNQLSGIARRTLLQMKDPSVAPALREALKSTQGILRIGIINTMGDRREVSAIGPLLAVLKGADDNTGRAVLIALSKIGGAPAADALDRVRVPDSLKVDRERALLICADTLTAEGNTNRSQKMLTAILNSDAPSIIRSSALVTLAKIQGQKAAPLIVKTLRSDDRWMKNAAVSAVIVAPGHATTAAFVKELPALPPDGQAALLAALASRGDAEGVTPIANRLAADSNPVLRQAGVDALDHLGDASSIPVLVANLSNQDLAGDASRSLVDIQGDNVSTALFQQAQTADPAVRPAILEVLKQRDEADALPTVRKELADPSPAVRMAALDVLAQLGTQDDLTQLSQMMLTDKDDSEQQQIALTMSTIGTRLPNPATRCDPIIQALPKADTPARAQLLWVLGTMGGDSALQALKSALNEQGDVRKAAIRGLGQWPDATPMPDLLAAAKDDADPSNKILALRGYIRLVDLSTDRPAAKAQDYSQAIALAARPDEKRQALAGLAKLGSPEALTAVQPSLDDPAVQREAYIAYEEIAERTARRQPEAARAALQKVADSAPDDNLKNRARAALQRIQ